MWIIRSNNACYQLTARHADALETGESPQQQTQHLHTAQYVVEGGGGGTHGSLYGDPMSTVFCEYVVCNLCIIFFLIQIIRGFGEV